ncbi:MAG: ribosome biogenesis GTP-binding protein YihA/YsxC [Syntrophobacterales bacterium]|nr:ribosome biogenesis GTP-binding protein YihA/YsxC [Syntrophobacterales bacterium]
MSTVNKNQEVANFKISSAEFFTSAFIVQQFPTESLPEIAFAGRSNVGKSSLINALLLRKKLVKTSNTPGRTQSINWFIINKAFYFVDLPGYGFAKVPKEIQAKWRWLIEGYLQSRKTLKGVVLIMDARHPAMPQDVQLYHWLAARSFSIIPVLTKVDKLSRNQWEKAREECARILAISPKDIVLFSAKEKTGRDELWLKIMDAII